MLERARGLGFLGPGPVEAHLQHSTVFEQAAPAPPSHALDLGSGAGVPGLMLARAWPTSRWVLLEAGERRAMFLRAAVRELGLDRRVTVVRARAESAGHDVARRGCFDLVVARSFGPPAVTAECGAPFLAVGGLLMVSEPPEHREERWPGDGLAILGLKPLRSAARVQVFEQVRLCPGRYPRRVGIPAKRPLWLKVSRGTSASMLDPNGPERGGSRP